MPSYVIKDGGSKNDAWAQENAPNHCHQMFAQIVTVKQILDSASFDVDAFRSLLQKNQNPYCGGDGTLSLDQWYAARDVADMVESLKKACDQFIRAPLDPPLRNNDVLPSKVPVDVSNAVFADEDIPF